MNTGLFTVVSSSPAVAIGTPGANPYSPIVSVPLNPYANQYIPNAPAYVEFWFLFFNQLTHFLCTQSVSFQFRVYSSILSTFTNLQPAAPSTSLYYPILPFDDETRHRIPGICSERCDPQYCSHPHPTTSKPPQ